MELSDKADSEQDFKETRNYIKEHPIRFKMRVFLEPGFVTGTSLSVPKGNPYRNFLLEMGTYAEIGRAYVYAFIANEIINAFK